MSSSFVSIVLLAGGVGSRMGSQIPKQYLPLGGKPLIHHSFFLFARLAEVQEIIVVCEEPYRSLFPSLSHPRIQFALPGARRQDSVWNGFCQISKESNLVCIHDSARPLLREQEFRSLLDAAREHGAAVLATPAKNTIKSASGHGFVKETLDRSTLWEIQTPQAIIPDWLHQGFAKARALGDLSVTDDVSLVELLGHPVKLVPGIDTNIKVTTPADLLLAERLLQS